MVRIPSQEELNALSAIDTIIHEGEELDRLPHHPGRTRQLTSWINSIANVAARYYGPQSEISRRVSQLEFFPVWPLQDGIHAGEALVDLPEGDPRLSDRRTAFRVLKMGISDALGLLDSLRQDIEAGGMPAPPKLEAGHPLINFQPSISQHQSQSQEQKSAVTSSMEQAVRVVRDRYGEHQATRAKEVLDQVQKRPHDGNTLNQALKYFGDLGHDALLAALPTLVKILVPG